MLVANVKWPTRFDEVDEPIEGESENALQRILSEKLILTNPGAVTTDTTQGR